jgi:hypothetical protein
MDENDIGIQLSVVMIVAINNTVNQVWGVAVTKLHSVVEGSGQGPELGANRELIGSY